MVSKQQTVDGRRIPAGRSKSKRLNESSVVVPTEGHQQLQHPINPLTGHYSVKHRPVGGGKVQMIFLTSTIRKLPAKLPGYATQSQFMQQVRRFTLRHEGDVTVAVSFSSNR